VKAYFAKKEDSDGKNTETIYNRLKTANLGGEVYIVLESVNLQGKRQV